MTTGRLTPVAAGPPLPASPGLPAPNDRAGGLTHRPALDDGSCQPWWWPRAPGGEGGGGLASAGGAGPPGVLEDIAGAKFRLTGEPGPTLRTVGTWTEAGMRHLEPGCRVGATV